MKRYQTQTYADSVVLSQSHVQTITVYEFHSVIGDANVYALSLIHI